MCKTILIAEDEKVFLNVLKQYFTLSGFTVYTAENCRDVIRMTHQYLPDCFLFDYHLGNDDIDPACLFIRCHNQLKSAPIVILSGDPQQAVNSYNSCQADVFLEKTIACTEILAAMNRQLRRAEFLRGSVRRSDLTLDSENMRILKEGKPDVCLSQEQFWFFSMLFKRSPKFVSEEELCRQVFKVDFSTSLRKALNMVVYRLRLKLGPQLARRIKNSKSSGWVYLQPRDRKKDGSVAEKAASSK